MTFSNYSSKGNSKNYYEDNSSFDHTISQRRGLSLSLVHAIHGTDLSTLQVVLLHLCEQNRSFRDLLSAELIVPGEEIDLHHLGTIEEKVIEESGKSEKEDDLENEKAGKSKILEMASLKQNGRETEEDESATGEEQTAQEEEDEELGSGYSSDTSSRDEVELLEGEAVCGQCRKKFNTRSRENDDINICHWHPGTSFWFHDLR